MGVAPPNVFWKKPPRGSVAPRSLRGEKVVSGRGSRVGETEVRKRTCEMLLSLLLLYC